MSTPVAKRRKRRGVVRASITCLGPHLRELQDTSGQPRTFDHARQLLTKLQSLDEEFRRLHFELIDLINEDDTLETEQATMDKHDDVFTLTVRVRALLTPAESFFTHTAPDDRKPLSRKLSRVQAGLNRINETVSTTATPVEHSLLRQWQEELSDYKKDLAALYDELVAKDMDDEDELFVTHSALERLLSDTFHKLKRSLAITPVETTRTADGAGVNPPKLDVPTYTAILTQIESCLNSCPLNPASTADDDGIEIHTPGHFLVGKPLTALPDPKISYRSITLLCHWHLCQCLVRHFWQRWCNEYLSSINKHNQWHYPTRNIAVGDVVVL